MFHLLENMLSLSVIFCMVERGVTSGRLKNVLTRYSGNNCLDIILSANYVIHFF